jgi:hypothetical protein
MGDFTIGSVPAPDDPPMPTHWHVIPAASDVDAEGYAVFTWFEVESLDLAEHWATYDDWWPDEFHLN